MSQIQLLPGLSIAFNEDGTWLRFDNERYKGAICLENYFDKDKVVGKAVQEWIQRIRQTPLA